MGPTACRLVHHGEKLTRFAFRPQPNFGRLPLRLSILRLPRIMLQRYGPEPGTSHCI